MNATPLKSSTKVLCCPIPFNVPPGYNRLSLGLRRNVLGASSVIVKPSHVPVMLVMSKPPALLGFGPVVNVPLPLFVPSAHDQLKIVSACAGASMPKPNTPLAKAAASQLNLWDMCLLPSLVIRADERRSLKAVRQSLPHPKRLRIARYPGGWRSASKSNPTEVKRDPNGGLAVGPRRSGLLFELYA